MAGPVTFQTRTLGRCLSCAGSDLRPMHMRYEFRGQRFPLVECAACGLRFLSVQPIGESLASLYSRDYFQGDHRCGRASGSAFSADSTAAENQGLVTSFEKLAKPGRLLEVGCGPGWLLDAARKRGWEVQGVELSADAAAHAKSLGLDVFHGDLVSANLPAEWFDVVYMGDVLEHVPDCRDALAEVARLLKPRGWLSLRGPITTNSLARRLGLWLYGAAQRDIVLREPPYHLWEFTPAALRRLLEVVGFQVAEMQQSKIPPGQVHGRKTALQQAVMRGLDTVNEPLTERFNLLGDRVTVTARKR